MSTSTVAIIGSGFGGLGMAYYLKQAGIDSFVLFEKAAEVGGTWRENTYPGSGCDIPSHLYSYSFESRYPWTWRYAKQSEILDYQRHVARKYDLRRHVRFNAAVDGADFDESRGVWVIRLADGGTHEAQFLVSAVGQLSRPAIPQLAGIERFSGKSFHSAHWDHGYDLRGKTVAVVGTGASAVQFVPEIAPLVKQLHVFQRTPGWVIPKVEKAFSGFTQWLLEKVPAILAADRARIFAICETLAAGYMGNKWIERFATALAKFHLWRQVRDPVLRRKLTPDYPVGCKRILLSNDWLPALTRPTTEVVTDAIAEVTATGIRTADGRERKVDAIIYGTGFAATEFLAPMRIRGAGGIELREAWKHGGQAYLGIAAAGFPNLFLLYGPNTNLGSGSIIFMLECQQRYITQIVQAQRASAGAWQCAEVSAQAQAAYVDEVHTRSAASTFEGSCQSWYKTEGRNTNNWIGSMSEYARRTAQPVFAHFRMSPAVESAPLRQVA